MATCERVRQCISHRSIEQALAHDAFLPRSLLGDASRQLQGPGPGNRELDLGQIENLFIRSCKS